MAGTHIWRRRAAAAVIAALASITLVACSGGGKGNTNNPPVATATAGAATDGVGVGGGGTPTATSDGGSNGDGSNNGGGGGGGAPTYPSDAKAYSKAALDAWMKKDYTRLGQLAQAAAVQQVKDSVTFGGLPSNSWHFINCEGAAGSSYCTYINDNGDVTHIRVINQVLGGPMAVQEIPLERTEYPKGAGSYVGAFLSAWQNGNRYRMLAYSSSGVVGKLPGTPLQAYTLSCEGAAGSTYVTVSEGGNAPIPRFVLRVGNELASAGAKHAIVEYLAVDPANPVNQAC